MEINWSLIAPLIVIQLVLMIVALLDLRKQEETNGSKTVWLFVIILVNTIGPIIYFIFGRKDS